MAKKKATKKKATKKATKKTTKKATRRSAAKEMLLVGSKTKEALKGGGLNVSSDALVALNDYVHWLIDQAQKRCEANGRRTVRPHDFMS